MSDYDRLKKLLKPTPCLAADAITGEVMLLTEAEAAETMIDAGPFPTKAIVRVGHTLEMFSRLKGIGKADREFKLREVADIAGLAYHLAYDYYKRGILTPSVRPFGGCGTGSAEARFSWRDAFVGGVIGTLRRHGIRAEFLHKVPALFTNSKKRTARKFPLAERP